MIEHVSPQALFAPPVFRVALAERERLRNFLRLHAVRRLIVVEAPAGYGKTWLLGRYFAELRAAGVAAVWLGIERADARQFLAMLVEGMSRAGIEVGSVEPIAAQGFADVPLAAAVRALSAALEASGTSVTIVVDDVQNLDKTVVDDVLARLLGEAPESTRFVLGGRDMWGLPRAALRARGDLCELGARDLRFTPDEASELLPQLQPAQLDRLTGRTEGWPVALQLARMWLDSKPERSSLLDSFSGCTSEVAEYLTEQVLADLSPQLQQILSEVAILDSLNADLVATVTESREPWARMLEDRRLDHFLVPLDEERYWFRLHHLLLDYLRARRQEAGKDARALHARAALWFESNGAVLDAVRHCVLADKIARAAGLIERVGGWELALFGGTLLMRALLGLLPVNKVREFPRVQLYHAFLAAKDGDLASALTLYEEVVATPRCAPNPAFERDLSIIGYLILTYADRPVQRDDLETLYREYQALPATDGVARATLLNSACVLTLRIGTMPEALEACTRALREMRHIGSVLGINYCLFHLGLAQLHLGERREAEATFREAAGMAEENFGADSGLRALAEIYLALALHARGDVGGAAKRLAASLEQVESADGWFDLYAEGYEVAIANAIARGDHEGAAAIPDRMRKTANNRGLIRLERLAAAFRVQTVQLLRLADAMRKGGNPESHEAGISALPPEMPTADWRDTPSQWREHHAIGIARVLDSLARDRPEEALAVLVDLEAAATAGCRRRQLRVLAALRGAVELRLNGPEAGMALFAAPLEAAVQEDDVQFLVDLGPVLWPLLQVAVVWSRNLARSRVRQILAAAIAAIARAFPERGVPGLLSARELEVLRELANGAPNKVIARNLQMTENTVKFHLKSVFKKLQVRHRAEALYAARTRGLLP